MKNILIEQNPHWTGNRSKFVQRDKLEKLIAYLPLRQIITITGIRRCGKSTLAKLAINHLIDTGVAPKNILYVNLEQPSFLEVRHDPSYLQTIYDTYLQVADPKGKTYVIFDEIQFFENWQVFIKSQYEVSDIKFIVTGSNSSMLSNELNTILSGRSLNIHLETFSFSEYLKFKDIAFATEIDKASNRIAVARARDEYLQWGGFYEVFTVDDPIIKKDILTSYAKNILYQDIIPRYGLRNAEAIERLFFYLLSNVTGVLNYTALANPFGLNKTTVEEDIRYFEDVFLRQRIDKFHNKPKERIKSSKKVYALDNGFLQIAPKHSEDLGKSLENAVFIKLNQNCEHLNYLKDIYEVDFYTDEALYQVAYSIDDEKTRKRELRSFGYFPQSEHKPCRLVTLENAQTEEDVEMINITQLLLND